jgi:hypothetical protein
MNHKSNEDTGEECGRINIKRIKEILERMTSTLAKNTVNPIPKLLHRYDPKHVFFLICILGGGIKDHAALRPLNGLLCQPRVIMIMEKSVE